MKRILLLLQLMIIAITLIGCTSSSGHEDLSVASDKKSQLITTNIDWFEQTASPIVVGNRLCDVLGFPDQSVPPKYEWVNLSETDDVETEYDNIDIALDYKTYRSNSIIRIHISNKSKSTTTTPILGKD